MDLCRTRFALAVAVATVALSTVAAKASEKRKLPEYGGRDPDPATPGDVALWVPRVALAPAYVVFEYGVRRPIGAGISGAERAHLPETLYNFFFFGPDHKAGIAPIAFFDLGFRPTIGLYTFWDDAFFPGHDLSLRGSFGGTDWLAGAFQDRVTLANGDFVRLRLAGVRRPDHAFFGIGPDTVQSNRSRYGERRLEGVLTASLPLGHSCLVEASLGVRSIDTYEGHYGGDPGLAARVATGAYPTPFGFDSGYTAVTTRLVGAFDTRQPLPAPGSGFRLELEGEQSTDVRRSPGGLEWVRYGAEAGAFLDLNGRNRVLSLSVGALFADPIGHQPIPFTELISVAARDPWMNDDPMASGTGPMQGFYPGRLLDRSAAVATLRYTWPIWVWLDGSIQAATGNVFGEHLENFEWSRLRLAGAVGVQSSSARAEAFQLLIGVGTETFERGTKLDSVRLTVGINNGF